MDKYDEEIKFWLQLSKNTNIGSATFSEILSKNVPLSKILSMTKDELTSLNLNERTVNKILKCQEFDADKILEDLKKREIKITRYIDEDYPASLKEIFDPPPVLYYKGTLNDDFKIGIVGSRRPSSYGTDVTYEIASFLANNSVCVVSGMAIGIDTIAHQATIDAGGKTIAVLGCGLDQIYPSRNVKLAKDIIDKGGAIITALPIGMPPLRHHFPLRNRIISGLSAGLIITEAAEKSGSLITATIALDQNRDIFAVPGPIHNINSRGPNNLIRLGAKIVTKPEDIIEEYAMEAMSLREKPKGDNEIEQTILEVLEAEPKHIDLIIKESNLAHAQVSTAITLMEISSKIKHIGGMVYKINY